MNKFSNYLCYQYGKEIICGNLTISPHDVHTQSPYMVKVKFIDLTSTRNYSGLLGWALYDHKNHHKDKTKKK